MHPVIESFLERPTSHKVLFWVGTLALVVLLFWQYLLKADLHARDSLNDKVLNLQAQIQDLRRIARDLPKFRAETADLDKKLEVVLRQLPDQKEIENLLKSVSVLAVDTGLEVIKFNPGGEVKRDFFAEEPVEIELRGTFHQLATFFDEVGHVPRIVNIRDVAIKIEMETKEEVLIRATCIATTFRYLEEQEQTGAPAAGGQDQKRRRGRSGGGAA
jgi:type IV pilus assembly protein PilO